MLLGLGRWGMSDNCQACLDAGYTCQDCSKMRVCGKGDCKSNWRMLGVNGFSGLGENGIGDTFNTITACGFMPILAGFALGYLAKQMRWI
ncbi:hypothetical protein L0244_27895 [bacterium]|nr:hypothetical protein [bacterium]